MVSDEGIAAVIRTGGIGYVCSALQSDAQTNALRGAMERSPAVRQAVADAITREGSRLIEEHKKSGRPTSEVRNLPSPLRNLLQDADARSRLRELMVSPPGQGVLGAAVRTTGGEFLVVGYMFNVPGGLGLVGRMMLSNAGRATAGIILYSATFVTPDPYFRPALPPYRPSEEGRQFRENLASDDGLRNRLRTRDGRTTLRDFFRQHEAEARTILRETLSSPEGVRRIAGVLTSDDGRNFLGMIGGSLGTRIAGDDLWNTGGGRVLVRQMLVSAEGARAIFGLITGFSI